MKRSGLVIIDTNHGIRYLSKYQLPPSFNLSKETIVSYLHFMDVFKQKGAWIAEHIPNPKSLSYSSTGYILSKMPNFESDIKDLEFVCEMESELAKEWRTKWKQKTIGKRAGILNDSNEVIGWVNYDENEIDSKS